MKGIIFILSLCAINSVFSQEGKQSVSPDNLSNYARYGIDYEVLGLYTSPDSLFLSQLDINQYEPYRHPIVNLEFKDYTNQITILLYSIEHTEYNKANPDTYLSSPWVGVSSKSFSTIYKVLEVDYEIIEQSISNLISSQNEIINIVLDDTNGTLTFIYTDGISKPEIENIMTNSGINYSIPIVYNLNTINSAE